MAVNFLGVFFPYFSAGAVQGLNPRAVQWAHTEKVPRETSLSGRRTGHRDWGCVGWGQNLTFFSVTPMVAAHTAPTMKLCSRSAGGTGPQSLRENSLWPQKQKSGPLWECGGNSANSLSLLYHCFIQKVGAGGHGELKKTFPESTLKSWTRPSAVNV